MAGQKENDRRVDTCTTAAFIQCILFLINHSGPDRKHLANPSFNHANAVSPPSSTSDQAYHLLMTCIFRNSNLNIRAFVFISFFPRVTQTNRLITGTANGSNESNIDVNIPAIQRLVTFGLTQRLHTTLSTAFSNSLYIKPQNL